MENALLVSNLALWVAVVVMAVVIVALVRQVGILYERVAPAGALMTQGGPRPGEPAPAFELIDLAGRPVRVGGASPEGRSTLLFFLSPSCPICAELIPVLDSIRRAERRWLEIVLASDGDAEEQRAFVERKGLSRYPYVLSTELGLAFQVGRLPYAALIDERGVLVAKGLANSREHLESLFEAKALGVASFQDYVARGGDGSAVA